MSHIQTVKEKETIRIKIFGALDEQSRLPENIFCEKLFVDFENLTTLNSSGIRTWINWTQQLKSVKKIYLENCRFSLLTKPDM